MLSFDDEVTPDIDTEQDKSLYLLVDGAQFDHLPKLLYQVSGLIELEPVYLYGHYESLKEVSPYVVKATQEYQDWFLAQNKPTAGFFFSSNAALDVICDHLRQLIKVIAPYGSKVFFKMAHSEAAWILLDNQLPHLWAVMDQVWLPTRLGWKVLVRPTEPMNNIGWPLMLTDSLWLQLQEIVWRNTVLTVQAHIEQYFPHLMEQEQADVWLDTMAKYAYRQGFSTEQDLFFFFNIIGFLGEEAVRTERYPDIYTRLTQPSKFTPSQRIEQAAELAYQISQTSSDRQEKNV